MKQRKCLMSMTHLSFRSPSKPAYLVIQQFHGSQRTDALALITFSI